jgi:cytochrome c-type biogenesis protein CcmF
MLPEIGNFALMLALCMAVIQSVVPLLGMYQKKYSWVAVAGSASAGQFFFVSISFAVLTYAFVTNDYSVKYVQTNSNADMPTLFRVSAVWGAHEGSILLWCLMLAGWSLAVSLFSRRLPLSMKANVLAIMGLICVGFLWFVLATSNPFERLLVYLPNGSIFIPEEGRSLNPLLQDFGLAIHPPILYMGYVGFSVAFAFAIAALVSGRLDAAWVRWSRPWTNIAWAFLSAGIVLGSWWAYYELGWGGWWFWDPVENASFMPWLVGTALIHSLAVSEKRGAFKAWTVLLAIFAFSLSLLGTFLVRSGVLTSVHSFTSDPERGAFILIFLIIAIGGALLLFAWRAPNVNSGGKFSILSRETFLLVTNVMFALAAIIVLLGTLFPLITEAFGAKYSVGESFFNEVFTPLMLPMLLIVALGPMIRWKQSAVLSEAWGDRLLYMMIGALALIIAGIFALIFELVDERNWVLLKMGFVLMSLTIATSAFLALPEKYRKNYGVMAVIATLGGAIFIYPLMNDQSMSFYLPIGIGAGVWIFITTAFNFISRLRSGSKMTASYLGMIVAHNGAAFFTIGVTVLMNMSIEKDVKLGPNESYQISGYEFTFLGTEAVQGPNYQALRGTIKVTQNGEPVSHLYPEKRHYKSQGNPMTEAGIDAGFMRDLYVALGEALGQDQWNMRLQYKPLVRWAWLGGLLMALGGVIAITDRRYRIAKRLKVA